MIIMCIIVFGGESFLPEYEDALDKKIPLITQTISGIVVPKYDYRVKYSDADMTLVTSGRKVSFDGKTDEYSNKVFLDVGPSRHFTYIFNIFVMMQIFNFLNARKI